MASKYFSVAQDELLIGLVKQHPVLYDPNTRFYNHAKSRHAAWASIANTMDSDPQRCRNRWLTIKDTHRRHIDAVKRKKTRCQTFPKHTRHALDFLNTVFEDRIKKLQASVVEDQPGTSKDTADEIDHDEVYEHTADDDHEYDTILGEEGLSTKMVVKFERAEEAEPSRKKSKKCDTAEIRGEPLKKMKMKYEFLEEPSQKKSKNYERDEILDVRAVREGRAKARSDEEEHPVNAFFSCMAEVVKTLPPALIAEARTRVCQVVSELELRALQQ